MVQINAVSLRNMHKFNVCWCLSSHASFSGEHTVCTHAIGLVRTTNVDLSSYVRDIIAGCVKILQKFHHFLSQLYRAQCTESLKGHVTLVSLSHALVKCRQCLI